MHDTTVVTKDGRTIVAPIYEFSPQNGFLSLVGQDRPVVIHFKDIKSAVTKEQRTSVSKVEDRDELKRAKDFMKEARQFGWFGMSKDIPLQKWERA